MDLALVLAVDCSYSVDGDEFQFQMQSIAEALRSKDVMALIRSGSHGSIAIVLLEWSGEGEQRAATPWAKIASEGDITAFTELLARTPRLEAGYTSISGAIGEGLSVLARSPYPAARRVIDISTDGVNNDGEPPDRLRDLAARAGVTVNGLAITREVPYLDLYFEHHVITGPGSFVLKADNRLAFRVAMKRKLLKEIQPVS